MPWILKMKGKEKWVKYTAHFGAFHGRVVYTEKKEFARKWSRLRDVERAAFTAEYRHRQPYTPEFKREPFATFEVIEEA